MYYYWVPDLHRTAKHCNKRTWGDMWLKEKLQSQFNIHAQWTSPSIQNELLDIVSSFVVERISHDVLLSKNVSLLNHGWNFRYQPYRASINVSLRYVLAGETKETFIGFFPTASTEGEVLYELVKLKGYRWTWSEVGKHCWRVFRWCIEYVWRSKRSSDSNERMFTARNIRSLLVVTDISSIWRCKIPWVKLSHLETRLGQSTVCIIS